MDKRPKTLFNVYGLTAVVTGGATGHQSAIRTKSEIA
jgi:hypothetical protein